MWIYSTFKVVKYSSITMTNRNIFISFTLLVVLSKEMMCRTKYSVTSFSKCPSPDNMFLILFDRSIEQCVGECIRRKRCGTIGYKRLLPLCELYKANRNNSTPFVDNKNCFMVERQDIIGKKSDCAKTKVYEEDSERRRRCVIKEYIIECKPHMNLRNGKYLGNLNQFGSKKVVICDQGYVELTNTTSVECLSDGTWTHDANCTEYQHDEWIDPAETEKKNDSDNNYRYSETWRTEENYENDTDRYSETWRTEDNYENDTDRYSETWRTEENYENDTDRNSETERTA